MAMASDSAGVVSNQQGAATWGEPSAVLEFLPTASAGPAGISKTPPVAKLQGRLYYPELDSIRFFLFCCVWGKHFLTTDLPSYSAHHVPMWLAIAITSMIDALMCSLDVFFIISGFLITQLLLRERDLTGTVDLKAFYVRRLLRIWPLYFFIIGLAILISAFDRSQALGWMELLSFLLFAGNWGPVLGHWSHAVILWPLWSVSFEEQFYLLWPLVLRRASRKFIYGIAIGLLGVGALARLILLSEHARASGLWFNSFVRVDSIACGILLALTFHRREPPLLGIPKRLTLLLLGGSAWVVVGMFCVLNRSDDPIPTVAGGMIGYPLMSLAGVAIFLSFFGAAREGASLLKNSGLVYLGNIAYGLYAYHYLGQQISDHVFARYHNHAHNYSYTLSAFFGLAVTFLLAAASFKWLETPFLRLKQRFTHVPSGFSKLNPKETSEFVAREMEDARRPSIPVSRITHG
jgi:peptidoglycan/LPS O-acetylase OafA/YrhL